MSYGTRVPSRKRDVVLGVDRGTPEEFFSRCLANAQSLQAAARRHAADNDRVAAFADAWGADMCTLQAVIWERILVAAHSPQRRFFQVAEGAMAGLRAPRPDADSAVTVGRALAGARRALADTFDESLADQMAQRWPDISYLESLAPVTSEDIDESVDRRLHGMHPGVFIEKRRSDASAAMLEAQTMRVRGETVNAISTGYSADLAAMEAYLVESAVATGDEALFSVTIRWDLAVHSVAELPGLPEDFAGALSVIRECLTQTLGEADGNRLREAFVPA